MTTQKMFELTMLALRSEELKPKALKQATSWIWVCETKRGFGTWPGSTARLCSTYQCLKLLEYAEVLPIHSAHQHIAWIKDLYQSSGFLRGPWSKRHTWEDTFYAIASLNLLGSRFEDRSYQDCLKWAHQILKFEGIQKDRLDAFLYSLEIIDILDILDTQEAELANKWLSSKIDGLLLTNISHN